MCTELFRGTRDTPNSMDTKAKSRGQMQTQMNASHRRHNHTRQAPDTQVSQSDRPTGTRGQPQTTTADEHERHTVL
jgi:hypothetical protein